MMIDISSFYFKIVSGNILLSAYSKVLLVNIYKEFELLNQLKDYLFMYFQIIKGKIII